MEPRIILAFSSSVKRSLIAAVDRLHSEAMSTKLLRALTSRFLIIFASVSSIVRFMGTHPDV